jgi:predicted nuclease of restriction endonuclease-like RecB superfamily
MLPIELLRFTTKKGKIYLKFKALDKENLEIAENLIEIYAAHLNRKRGELLELLKELEKYYDYRYIRGLIALLDRRCSFEVCSAIEPWIARRKVFEETNRFAPVTTHWKRDRVLQLAASKLNITKDELEKSLFADLDEEVTLKSFSGIAPNELLKWYNLSLVQTLLFKAASLEFEASEGHGLIVRRLKNLGLMYFAEKRNHRVCITIEGALTLFKLTERYGTSLAKLIPVIFGAREWRVKASIVLKNRGAPRIYEFELDSSSKDLLAHFEFGERDIFDSAIEKNFAHRFNALKTGWTLKREPEPLIAGTSIFIPDFALEKDGIKIYLEIAGFYTEDYLRRKLQKLKQLNEANIIICVDKNLACSNLDLDAISSPNLSSLIFFEKEIPLKPVLDYLREMEEKRIESEVTQLKNQLYLEGDIMSVAELAKKHGTNVEVIKRIALNTRRYKLIGEQLISEEAMENLRSKVLELFPNPNLKVVIDQLRSRGIINPELLLYTLGFEVKWDGLDIERAIVISKGKIEDI